MQNVSKAQECQTGFWTAIATIILMGSAIYLTKNQIYLRLYSSLITE